MQCPQVKTIAMACDADSYGIMKTGWILSQLDLAAGIAVKEFTQKRSVTVSFDEICFHKPILVGDLILCYANIAKTGRTSISIDLKIDIKRLQKEGFILHEKLVSAKSVFVSLDENGKKIVLENLSL
ncbi:acyl-CoA thioesterase [Campylobacter sp. MIT 99-7217]|uniref:acyl-CoA thioesterase n=1 Tax=Campylobacter sp. MIT 99-7217 TaxID=535091 RepID=UPI00115868C7|nr:hotdog domain-containing protein [Campylobacter sp. MIT 99-7217]TQR34575.1 acyl-CoA thioesterase [Campylobacter sp. MIT 99-7217]